MVSTFAALDDEFFPYDRRRLIDSFRVTSLKRTIGLIGEKSTRPHVGHGGSAGSSGSSDGSIVIH